jgi:hypothetical protein
MAEKVSAAKGSSSTGGKNTSLSGELSMEPTPFPQHSGFTSTTARTKCPPHTKAPHSAPSSSCLAASIQARAGPLRGRTSILVDNRRNAHPGTIRSETRAERPMPPDAPTTKEEHADSQRSSDEQDAQEEDHEETAKNCGTWMTSVPRPGEVPDGSPFSDLPDDLEEDHSVDGFSDEDAESDQDDVGPPYAMVGQDEITEEEEQDEELLDQKNLAKGKKPALTTSVKNLLTLKELQTRQAEMQTSALVEKNPTSLGARRHSPRFTQPTQSLPTPDKQATKHASGSAKLMQKATPGPPAPVKRAVLDLTPPGVTPKKTKGSPSEKKSPADRTSAIITSTICSTEKNNHSKKRAEYYAVGSTSHPYWRHQVPLVTTDWEGVNGAYVMSQGHRCAFRSFKGPHAEYLANAFAFSAGWVSHPSGTKSAEDHQLYAENFGAYGSWNSFVQLINSGKLVPPVLKVRASSAKGLENDAPPTAPKKSATMVKQLKREPSNSMEVRAVAGVEILRKVFDIFTMLPALVHMWDMQQSCPLVTHGHRSKKAQDADRQKIGSYQSDAGPTSTGREKAKNTDSRAPNKSRIPHIKNTFTEHRTDTHAQTQFHPHLG